MWPPSPHTSRPSRAWLLSLLHALVISVLVNAQVAPRNVAGPAFTRLGSKLYIAGGHAVFNNTVREGYSQLFYMDLSVNWPASTPVWRQLSGGPDRFVFPSAISKDGNTLVTLGSGTVSFGWRYDIKADKWTHSRVTVPQLDRQGLVGVTDPDSGLAYFVCGYDLNPIMNNTAVYDFDKDVLTSIPLPPGSWRSTRYYQAVWSPVLKTILYFGGTVYEGTQDSTLIMQYSPSKNLWTPLDVKNPPARPSPRNDHCMAISEDGSKLVVFGGRNRDNSFNKEIYVLDMKTLLWIQGPDFSSPRGYAACTIVGSTFISWGGQDATQTADGAAILYDLNKNDFIQQYVAPVVPPPTGPSSGSSGAGGGSGSSSGDGSGQQSGSSGGVIGGAVAGVCVLIAIVAFFIVRRRRGKVEKRPSEDSIKLTPVHADGGDGDSKKEGGSYSPDSAQGHGYNDLYTKPSDYVPPPPSSSPAGYPPSPVYSWSPGSSSASSWSQAPTDVAVWSPAKTLAVPWSPPQQPQPRPQHPLPAFTSSKFKVQVPEEGGRGGNLQMDSGDYKVLHKPRGPQLTSQHSQKW